MTRFSAVPPDAVRARWHRWKFHLAGLLLVAPLAYAPNFVTGGQYADPGRRVLGPRVVGPWTATLAEPAPGPPKRDAAGRLVKDYTVILCPGCAGAVRTAHLHVGEPDAPRTAGVLLHGNPYRLEGHLSFPETIDGDEEIWLTLEGWDGTLHRASWPVRP